ncbi:MAG: TetR/AcrR family transcriptional regulator [Desulforegulaceae bacterium]|nr:TetR/AcrR family transcriptional regulator [Desulforegulaceae bacterium]
MKASLRKKKILECSKKEFSKNGFYKTQIADIAKAANISRATVYQYFNNKDEIYMTLLSEQLTKWKEMMKQNEIDVSKLTPAEYFSYQVRKTLKYFAGDRYISNIVLRVGIGIPKDIDKPVKHFEESILAVIIDELEKGIKSGFIKKEIDTEFISTLIAGAILRTSSYYFGPYKRKKPINIKQAADEITSIFGAGLFTQEGLSFTKK